MVSPSNRRRRDDGLAIFQAALAAVDPAVLVRRALRVDGEALWVCDERVPLAPHGRLVVCGAGKATPQMARAALDVLGDRISAGAINTKHDHGLPLDGPGGVRIDTVECAHPIPDNDGVRGAQAIFDLVGGLTQDDVVLCLLSGGGSALMPLPAEGLSLADKQETTSQLLACGATIDETNAIRKHLSRIKGGGLARQAAPARVVSLLISDVIGDPPGTIASGPTAADPTTYADCLRILDDYGIAERIPAVARQHLQDGADGRHPETPGPNDPIFERVVTHVVGSNHLAVEAARAEARRRGYQPLVLSTQIRGETVPVAGMHTALARQALASGDPAAPPLCLISGGETTVTLGEAPGKGGRNQEFALAAALDLAGSEGITALCCGTDGTDGPTDAAGGVVDGTTVARAAQAGLDAREHLRRHDAYPLLAAVDDLVVTGPTGTNVMDLRLLLVS